MNDPAIVFNAILTELPDEVPKCGDIKVAVAYKFRINKKSSKSKSKILIAIVKCPEFLGENFFIAGKEYHLSVCKDDSESLTYTLFNIYDNEENTWWVADIKIISEIEI